VNPLGEKPVGYIFYNHDGYMSVEIMAPHRAPYQEPDAFGGTPEERSEAISTYLSYSGPFEVLADQDTVIHHIEVCSYPNWIGNAQVRFAKLDGDLLISQHQADDLPGRGAQGRARVGARRPRLTTGARFSFAAARVMSPAPRRSGSVTSPSSGRRSLLSWTTCGRLVGPRSGPRAELLLWRSSSAASGGCLATRSGPAASSRGG